MPNNDIEEFLRRAAQRRQAKAGQVSSAPPQAPSRPEYTSAKSERVPRNQDDEQPVQAILIESEKRNDSVAVHMKDLSDKRALADAQTLKRRAGGSVSPPDPATSGINMSFDGKVRAPSDIPQAVRSESGANVTDRLITMLKQPEGMMQAILLQEIFRRPEDRW